jgi:hypothetical protein
MDELTVAIIPHHVDDAKDADGMPLVYRRVHLIFGSDGQLAERRLVEMPSGKTLLRDTYEASSNCTTPKGRSSRIERCAGARPAT